MIPDFTLALYKRLLNALSNQGFSFSPLYEFILQPKDKAIILRHDVDALPFNSLRFALIQAEIGIRGSYYFRIVPESWDERIIEEIAVLGHEIGYHYEDVSLAAKKRRAESGERRAEISKKYGVGSKEYEEFERELVDIGIESFAENLAKLRKIAPVNTICMHGSPMSRWDSRLLWKYYDYHDYGIIGEPYFDIDFDEVLYLTDTGRRWDGDSVNIRDKAQGSILRKASDGKAGLHPSQSFGWQSRAQSENPYKEWKVKPFSYRTEVNKNNIPPYRSPALPLPLSKMHSSSDIIKAAEENKLPDKLMMTFHPQRWTDRPVPWVKELVWQNVKNVGKYFLVKVKSYRYSVFGNQ